MICVILMLLQRCALAMMSKTVQETFRHYTAAFTLDVYGHVSEQMRWESARRMEGFIQSVRQMPENQLS